MALQHGDTGSAVARARQALVKLRAASAPPAPTPRRTAGKLVEASRDIYMVHGQLDVLGTHLALWDRRPSSS